MKRWRHTLRMLELTDHPEVKVYPGAIFPLINSKEEIARWSSVVWKGAVSGGLDEERDGEICGRSRTGRTRCRSLAGRKSDAEGGGRRMRSTSSSGWRTSIAHEVTDRRGRADDEHRAGADAGPEGGGAGVQELVVMGGSIAPDVPLAWRTENRREFNFWWDPEAVHIVLRAPWKKITVTTVDISVKTRMTNEMIQKIAGMGTPSAAYIGKYSDEEYLWDELAAVAWVDPSVITKEVTLYMDMDISHTAGYGNTTGLDGGGTCRGWGRRWFMCRRGFG